MRLLLLPLWLEGEVSGKMRVVVRISAKSMFLAGESRLADAAFVLGVFVHCFFGVAQAFVAHLVQLVQPETPIPQMPDCGREDSA